MTHTLVLIACLSVGWGLALAVMHLAPRLERLGDRRAMHQLALFSPLLALSLSGLWSAQMALTGCLMFSAVDGIGTVLLLSAVVASLVVAGIRESWRIAQTRRQLDAIAVHDPGALRGLPVRALAERVGVRRPKVRILETSRPVACVAGVVNPRLFLSRGMLEGLTRPELEGLLAHELAHLRHLDNLLAWLDIILFRAFSFIPPLRTAWSESLAEREAFADACAATATGKPRTLARALVKAASMGTHEGPALAGATGFMDHAELLEQRVERLLNPPPPHARPWGLPAVGALAVAVVLPFASAWTLGAMTECLFHIADEGAGHHEPRTSRH